MGREGGFVFVGRIDGSRELVPNRVNSSLYFAPGLKKETEERSRTNDLYDLVIHTALMAAEVKALVTNHPARAANS
jgi:hypothetical protein